MAINQNKSSTDIKVNIEGGVAFVEHSDAYIAQQERFFADERFTKQERIENEKMIAAEELQMLEARRDPVAFIKQQRLAKGETAPIKPDLNAGESLSPQFIEAVDIEPNSEIKMKADHVHHPLEEDERLAKAKQAFADATEPDRVAAEKNLLGIQQQLLNVAHYTGMTPEQLAMAQKKAYIDQGEKLNELNETANKKANALTWDVANFAQGDGKTMLNADIAGNAANLNMSAEAHRGIDVPGLDLAEVNASANTTDMGVVSAGMGVRGVKNIYSEGSHNVFLAAAADMTASGFTESDLKLGGAVTGLVVNTHTLADRPTSEIIGAKVDLLTGETTAIGTVAQTFNAETKYATTARAVGTYSIESGSGGLSFEAYQRAGIEGLTARLNVAVSDVGGDNAPSAGVGISYGW